MSVTNWVFKQREKVAEGQTDNQTEQNVSVSYCFSIQPKHVPGAGSVKYASSTTCKKRLTILQVTLDLTS